LYRCIPAVTLFAWLPEAPFLKGDNMSEKRQHFLREYDWIRKVMFEPRGHDMMSGEVFYILLMIPPMM
jgi:proline racemase